MASAFRWMGLISATTFQPLGTKSHHGKGAILAAVEKGYCGGNEDSNGNRYCINLVSVAGKPRLIG